MQVESDIAGDGESTPIRAAFGDLMSVLLGVFVLVLVGVTGVHPHLETRPRQKISIDGEIAAKTPVTVEVADAAITVAAPREEQLAA